MQKIPTETWATSFHKDFVKNILFCVNARPLKIRSLHTYEVHTLDVLLWLDLYTKIQLNVKLTEIVTRRISKEMTN